MNKALTFRLFLLAFILNTLYLILYTSHAFAQTSCPPIFGGGETCVKHPNISVDKQVLDPQSKKYVDHLTVVSNILPKDQTVTFRIIVKNTSNNPLSNIRIEDVLPAYLLHKSGNGAYDAKMHKVTDTIDKLERNQSTTHTINTTLDLDKLEKSSACSINQAMIIHNNKNGSDYVRLCINISGTDVKSGSTSNTKGGLKTTPPKTTKGGLPIFSGKTQSKTPDTGPEMAGIIGLPLLASAGYYLRKNSKLI